MISIAQILDEDNPDSEGQYIGDELHTLTCPCPDCAKENARLERLWSENRDERSDDERYESFEAYRAECADRVDAREYAEGWAFWYKCLDAAEGARELDAQTRASFTHTLPLVPGEASELPAILTRSDGRTLLYEGRLNAIFGEPGLAKSWLALMACIEVVRTGTRVIWWDFEDRPDTIVTRLKALGAGELVDSEKLIYATPGLADDAGEMDRMAGWMARGPRPGLVVIDSVESAGLPTDSNDAAPWYAKHVDPFEDAGAGILLLDHVPKRKLDRPKGPIGSTHKLARLSGAGLFISGTPWTKEADGRIVLTNHKDRPGDLPAPLMKAVAVVEVTHGENGLLIWSINPPDDADDDQGELTGRLLEAIASHGQEGVKGSKAIRGLVKAKGQLLDAALEEPMSNGMVARRREGRPYVYFATENGMDMSS